VASAERLEENRRLRECYAADPEGLSEEDRARARALVERDERKRAKKTELRHRKEGRKERTMQARSNRKRARGGHKAAMPALDRAKRTAPTEGAV
jgi:hypothetical protein